MGSNPLHCAALLWERSPALLGCPSFIMSITVIPAASRYSSQHLEGKDANVVYGKTEIIDFNPLGSHVFNRVGVSMFQDVAAEFFCLVLFLLFYFSSQPFPRT